MSNHRITTFSDLLFPNGTLMQKGYSTKAVMHYNRGHIKAAPWRIKEWDFYQVSSDDFCLQLTIGHASYAGQVTAMLIDLKNKQTYTVTDMLILPFNQLGMPESAEHGDLAVHRKNIDMKFEVYKGGRRLRCKTHDPKAPHNMEIDIELVQSDLESLVIATPFNENPKYFYYNHKINCMPASGTVKMGDRVITFDPDTAFGLLDWGRGVWPFNHEWFWGNGSTLIDGKRFGFNIGFGFGNTEAATENMLFYDGNSHKLNHVYVDFAANGYMSPKTFSSDDGRFEMDFEPVFDRYTETKMLFVDNSCHQIFGRFTGKAVLNDGTVIEVKDMMAFMEHAVNHW
ncbi:DUF2804 domain-containing protein [Paenibacillus sp.]|jgi:hypothetical protein|uniref:DUF2804 domain-containing protein n=1 Tax=Paenibacillus sp. TaxID=58172 RepID=UPI002829F1DB|nr:DUF2804 domain-containing protein [Paenibacillus sp.]MDR0269875.1 DUF2804 domain-containing protein [Paenibacillus sp.]